MLKLKITPPPPPNLQKCKYFQIFKRGYSLVELLTVVGILGALSTVAITQYNKYQKTATDRTIDSTIKWNTANCINALDVNQCYCEKGLAELVGLKPNDCCPEGQVKDSNNNCVILQALNTKAQKNSKAGNTKSKDKDPEEESQDDPSPLPTCNIVRTLRRDIRSIYSDPHCNCPEGMNWGITTLGATGINARTYRFVRCTCTSFQNTDSKANCYRACIRYQDTDPNAACYGCVRYQNTDSSGQCYWADCPTNEQGRCGPRFCPSGQVLDGATCVSSCSGEKIVLKGICRCPANHYELDSKCVPNILTCGEGGTFSSDGSEGLRCASCGEGATLNSKRQCVCKKGKVAILTDEWGVDYRCVDKTCPGTGQIRDTRYGDCMCPPNKLLDTASDSCVDSCPTGTYETNSMRCVANSSAPSNIYTSGGINCPKGTQGNYVKHATAGSGPSSCYRQISPCPRGQVRNYAGECDCWAGIHSLWRNPDGECVARWKTK